MSFWFRPLPSDLSNKILCYYVNSTTQIQRARISNIPNWLFERIIFPKQRIFFEAIPDALLEIHGHSSLGEILLNKIPCLRLQVSESENLLTNNITFQEFSGLIDWVEE